MKYSWDEITLENYAAIDALSRTTPTDYTQHMVSLLALVSGKAEEHFEAMSLTELKTEAEACAVFLRTEPTAHLIKSFWINKRRFTIKLTQEEVTAGQAMSVSLLKLTGENMASKMPELLAAITEETKFPFRKQLSFAQRVELFKKLPASIGIAICVFFWEVSKELQSSSITYLENQLKELEKKAKSLLDQTSGG